MGQENRARKAFNAQIFRWR